MELFNFDPALIMSFFLTLFRISIILFLMPFFGGESVPAQVKGALCVVLTLALFKHLSFPGSMFPAHPFSMVLMIGGELILGMLLGLAIKCVFAAIRTGGQLIGFQMGFAMVNVVDPDTGTSQAVTSHFLYMIALLTFLTLNGHLLLFKGIAESFQLVPPGGLLITSTLRDNVMAFSANMFILSVKIAAPVMAALFLVDVALALVGRAAPEMNILMLGFPLKIAIGFFFLGLLFTIMAMYMRDFMIRFGDLFHQVLTAAAG